MMPHPGPSPAPQIDAPDLSQVLRQLGADRAAGPAVALDPDNWLLQLAAALGDSGLSIREGAFSSREVVGWGEADGSLVTCTSTDSGHCRAVVVTPTAKRRARVTLVDSAGTRRLRLSAKQLAAVLGADGPTEPVAWGQVALARPLESLRTPSGERPDVLRRLRRLVRLERTTLQAVVVYALVVGILALATPLAVQSVVNTVAFGTLLQPLVILTLLLLVGLLFAGALHVLETVVVEYMQRRLFARMAADLAHRLPDVDPQAMQQRDLRALANQFLDVATLQKVASALLLDGVGLALQAFVGLLVLAFYHPLLLAFDVILVLVPLVVLMSVGRRAVATAIGESKAKYAVLGWLQQMALSVPLLRDRSTGHAAIEHADALTHAYLGQRESHFGLYLRQLVALVVLQAVASATLLGLGGWLVIRGQLTLGQLVAAELIVTAVVGGMAKFGKHLEQFYDIAASVDKLGQLIDLPLAETGRNILPAVDREAALSIVDARLGYMAAKPVLQQVDLRVAAGRRTALTGAAGSGKSLLLSTLAGDVAPLSGDVRLGGEPLQSLRSSTVGSAVRLLSSPTIGSGTLLELVRFRRVSISDKQVVALLQQLGAGPLLDGLPEGIQTRVAGPQTPLPHDLQLQLCLARELLSRPAVLLLDGALDGASPACREAVLQTLAERAQTTVIATHHPQLISACDRVLRLVDGRVVEV